MTRLLMFALLAIASSSAKAETAVLDEVKAFYGGYVQAYTSRQAQSLIDEYMLAPLYFRNFEDNVYLGTKREVSDYLVKAFSQMSRQNYASSEILASNFCVLSETSAIVSVAFRRLDTAGNVLVESGATYSLFKLGGHWRFTMISTHTAEQVVSCSPHGE